MAAKEADKLIVTAKEWNNPAPGARAALLERLATDSSLHALVVHGCGLDADGIKSLTDATARNPAITRVDVEDSYIGQDGMALLQQFPAVTRADDGRDIIGGRVTGVKPHSRIKPAASGGPRTLK